MVSTAVTHDSPEGHGAGAPPPRATGSASAASGDGGVPRGARLSQAVQRRIADYIVAIVLPMLIVIAIAASVFIAVLEPGQPLRYAPALLVLLAAAPILRVGRRHPHRASTILFIVAGVTVALGVVANGGLSSPAFYGVFGLMVGVASFYGMRVGVALGVGAVLFGVAAWAADEAGWLPDVPNPPEAVILAALVAWLAVAIVFAAAPVRILHEALRESEATRADLEAARAREREQEVAYQALFATATHLLGTLDLEGRMTLHNPAWQGLGALAPGELLGRPLADAPWWIEDSRARLREGVAAARVGQVDRFELSLVARDGTVRSVDLGVRPVLDAAGGVVRLIVEGYDTTEVRRAQRALSEEQQRYEAVFRHANDAILLMRGGRFVASNPRASELFGRPREVIAGTTPEEVSPLHQPDGRTSAAAAAEAMQAAATGRPVRFDWRHLRADGSPFDVEVGLSAVTIGGEPHLLAILRDLGERRQLEERLRHAERLDSVGQLAGGVAHDFNNMLAAIIGATDLLRVEARGAPAMIPWLDMLAEASHRAADLTSKLLTFARKGPEDFAPTSVHDAIEVAVSMLRRSLDKRVVIALDLAAPRDYVRGSAQALQNVVLNLGINAAHAMPQGGTLSIATGLHQLDPSECERRGDGLVPGEYLVLSVADTGQGIAPEILGRIFDPFFTTKPQGQGTGLGLAAVYGAMLQHGGAIRAESTAGQGARFELLLPLLGAVERPRVEVEPAEGARGVGRVLVVDDEAAVRRAARAILRALGYEVTEAEHGQEALARFAEAPADVVLLDQNMPLMSGRDVLARLRALDPSVRVILTSGAAPEESGEAVGFLRKPYGKAELGQAVARALAMGGG